MGSGVGKPGAEVRWGVAGRMAVAWLVTLPLAGLVGATTYGIVHLFGGYPGAIIGFSLLCLASAAIWLRSRTVRVDHHNVNAVWEGNLTTGLENPKDSARKPPEDREPQSDMGPKPGARFGSRGVMAAHNAL